MNTPNHQIRSITGPIPEPYELYGRDDILQSLWNTIQANNILLLAPRRFGKSGIMRHVLLHPQQDFLPLPFELEDVDSPQEFVWRITREVLGNKKLRNLLHNAKGLPSEVVTWVKNTFNTIEFEGAKVEFKAQIEKNWKDTAMALLTELKKSESALIFLLDEFPSMIINMTKKHGKDVVNDFLAWFRTVRLHQKDLLRRHRFIVAGSIGIDQVLRNLDATDKFNDFARITVEPLQDKDAQNLALDLAALFEIPWNTDLSDKLIKLIGSPVPYFIHVFFSELGKLPLEQKQQITGVALTSVYRNYVLGPTCRHYFEHYNKRLAHYGKTEQKAARAILRAVANKNSVSREELYQIYTSIQGETSDEDDFNSLMADLEYECYLSLSEATNSYSFRLKVIQDWWLRWYPSNTKTQTL